MTKLDEIRQRCEAAREIPVEAMKKQQIAQMRIDNRCLLAMIDDLLKNEKERK